MGHEGHCRHPHGHNYVAEITCAADLDALGRVIDFGIIRQLIGGWIDARLDHAFLLNADDKEVLEIFNRYPQWKVYRMTSGNPTAENIARDIANTARELLQPSGVRVVNVRIHETENCYADAVPGE
jgi:6-pyruvoyltetrahydropterin/6-carboxytetrahydropterin synthase